MQPVVVCGWKQVTEISAAALTQALSHSPNSLGTAVTSITTPNGTAVFGGCSVSGDLPPLPRRFTCPTQSARPYGHIVGAGHPLTTEPLRARSFSARRIPWNIRPRLPGCRLTSPGAAPTKPTARSHEHDDHYRAVGNSTTWAANESESKFRVTTKAGTRLAPYMTELALRSHYRRV